MRQRPLTNIAIFFIILLSAAACNNQDASPKNLIEEEKYINLMIEMQLLKTYQIQSKIDSTRVDSLMHAIFEKYDVTKHQFKQSHKFYQNKLKNQDKRIEAAIDRLRKDRYQKPDSTVSDSIKTKP